MSRGDAQHSGERIREQPAEAKSPRIRDDGTPRAIVVLGMHRSGTSAFTRVFALLGADLPKDLLPSSPTNQTGYWESSALTVIHDEILRSRGSRWDDWRAFDPAWFDSPAAEPFKRQILDLLRRDFADSRLFAIKDPRICRLWPLWRDVLAEFGAKPLIVIPVRNPLEVAASLGQRDSFASATSLLLWLRHVLDAESATRGLPRAVADYESLLRDWRDVIGRVASRLDLSWPRRGIAVETEIEQFLSKQLRHHTSTPEELVGNPELADWVKEAYAGLAEMTQTPEHPGSLARLDRIGAAFESASMAFGSALTGREMELAKQRANVSRLAQELKTLREQTATETKTLREQMATEMTIRNARIRDLEARLEAALAKGRRQRESSWIGLLAQSKHRAERRLRKSGLFDAGWYLREYPDVAKTRGSPVTHYLEEGYLHGYRPNPLFDTRWYLDRYEDVRHAGVNPLLHYIRNGWREGRDPSPEFETDFYLQTYPDVRISGINPLAHYLRYGKGQGRLAMKPRNGG